MLFDKTDIHTVHLSLPICTSNQDQHENSISQRSMLAMGKLHRISLIVSPIIEEHFVQMIFV